MARFGCSDLFSPRYRLNDIASLIPLCYKQHHRQIYRYHGPNTDEIRSFLGKIVGKARVPSQAKVGPLSALKPSELNTNSGILILMRDVYNFKPHRILISSFFERKRQLKRREAGFFGYPRLIPSCARDESTCLARFGLHRVCAIMHGDIMWRIVPTVSREAHSDPNGGRSPKTEASGLRRRYSVRFFCDRLLSSLHVREKAQIGPVWRIRVQFSKSHWSLESWHLRELHTL